MCMQCVSYVCVCVSLKILSLGHIKGGKGRCLAFNVNTPLKLMFSFNGVGRGFEGSC